MMFGTRLFQHFQFLDIHNIEVYKNTSFETCVGFLGLFRVSWSHGHVHEIEKSLVQNEAEIILRRVWPYLFHQFTVTMTNKLPYVFQYVFMIFRGIQTQKISRNLTLPQEVQISKNKWGAWESQSILYPAK